MLRSKVQIDALPGAIDVADPPAYRESDWQLAGIRAGLPQVYPETHEAFIAQMQPGNDNPYQLPWLLVVVVGAAISLLLSGRDIRLLAKILLAIETHQPYLIVETSRGCTYACDFCVAPIHQGHKFRERTPKSLVDEIERGYREFGVDFFYLWGDTVTLNVKAFSAFCEASAEDSANWPVQAPWKSS